MARKRMTAAKLRNWLVWLFPMIERSQLDVVIGADLGEHLGFTRTHGARVPKNDVWRYSFVVLLDEDTLRLSWETFISTAVHEYAHVLRALWSAGFSAADAFELTGDAERTLRGLMFDDMLDSDGPHTDGEAFGSWIHAEGCGADHDAFFFFIEATLVHKAARTGWFNDELTIVRGRTTGGACPEYMDQIAAAARTHVAPEL